MAKATKEFQWRMDGILFAHKIVSEGGLEALEKEIRMRNYLKLDLWAKKSDVENLEFELSTNLYNSFLSTMLFTLHDTFGFAKVRLCRLKEAFDRNVGNIFNIDWLGNNYVRFEDYAKYINEEFGFNFDVTRIAVLHDVQAEKQKDYHRLDRDATIKELREKGFKDAAQWLESKFV
jgi:hypothetical protein